MEVELEAHADLARLLVIIIHDQDHELWKSRFMPNSALVALQRHIELESV